MEGSHVSKVGHRASQSIVGQVPENIVEIASLSKVNSKQDVRNFRGTGMCKFFDCTYAAYAYSSATFVRLLRLDGTGPLKEFLSRRLYQSKIYINYQVKLTLQFKARYKST